jgi:hypothetical protein
MSFNYTEGSHVPRPNPRGSDKRGASSTTQLMLLERQANIHTEEQATGQPPTWDRVYSLMRCSSAACELGPYCWRDPISKKHIKLTVQNLRALVSYAEEGGLLKTHDDVAEPIRKSYIYRSSSDLRGKREALSPPMVTPLSTSPTFFLRMLLLFLCQLHRLRCRFRVQEKRLQISSKSLVYGTLLLLNIVTGSNPK